MTFGNGQGEPKGKEPVDWVVDLFVHTPIGLAVMAWKRVPEFVSSMPDLVGQALSKGCAQLAEAEERISEEVRKARMIGEVAVTFGGRQLRREVDTRLRDAREAAGGVASFLPGAGGGPNGADAPGAPKVSATATPTAPASPPHAGAEPPSAKTTAAKTTAAKTTSGQPAAPRPRQPRPNRPPPASRRRRRPEPGRRPRRRRPRRPRAPPSGPTAPRLRHRPPTCRSRNTTGCRPRRSSPG